MLPALCTLSPQLGISPHAPYTVSPELLSSLVELAAERELPVAMHVAESAEELELLAAGTGPLRELLDQQSMWDSDVIPRGSRPLEYLHMLARAPRAMVIHGNYLRGAEHDFLAAYADQMTLVFCPRTHARFDHPPYPLAQLLDLGVRVALGTDSRASNPDLCLLSEMRHVARCHPAVSPAAILRMGTLVGAQALGREADSGSIEAGKWADLVALPLFDIARGTPDEVLTALLHADDGPTAVWQRGVAVASLT